MRTLKLKGTRSLYARTRIQRQVNPGPQVCRCLSEMFSVRLSASFARYCQPRRSRSPALHHASCFATSAYSVVNRRSSSPTLPLPAASFSNGTGFSTKLSPLEVPCSNSEERQGGAEGKPTGILYRKKVTVDLGGFLERSSMEFDTTSCLWPETGLVSSSRVSGVDLPEKANDEEEKTSRKWATKCSLPQVFYFVDAS